MGSTTGPARHSFPPSMVFQKTWRAYQRRVLDQLEVYLEDKRFHLVSAPGSGKTVLGLEVVRRIGQPTLVLAPTITIRDQWADRLVDHFLPAGESRPAWVSTDIKSPALLTIATYQALHALCSGGPVVEAQPDHEENGNGLRHDADGDETEDAAEETFIRVPAPLSAARFRTVVVDEAHHLRAEWWKTLTSVVEQLDQPTIVALTATPPYDVSPFEWQRYEELCGPVDAEVSVPELVQQGDLCPHQDYVYFSTPAGKEQQTLAAFRAGVESFVHRLRSTEEFKAALKIHPWMLFPHSHIEEILDNPQYLSSMLVYLKASDAEISGDLLKILGLPDKRIPPLDLDWLEILLSNCLFADAGTFEASEGVFKSFRHELVTLGAIGHRRVTLRNPPEQARLLTTSTTKLKSITEIVWLESSALADRLRCVVLTDFIRKSEMPSQDGEAVEFEDIGVVPIFETLRRARPKGIRLGVLSGSIVLVPAAAAPSLRTTAAALGVRPDDLSLTPLRHDPDYLLVELHGEYLHGTVRLITAIFEQGEITVLVGTKSLLGEGWDAPCINTLILASFVGSFVLSNQMRGRSIRNDSHDPEKTANIWHLVCLEPGEPGPGEDYALLERRCRTFVGLASAEPALASGTERLGLGHPPFTLEQVAEINASTRKRALDRYSLRHRWQDALAAGPSQHMAAGLKAPKDVLPRAFLLSHTITSVLVQSGSTFAALLLEGLRNTAGIGPTQDVLTLGVAVAGISAVLTLPWAVEAGWRFIRHGTPQRSIQQIGRVVLESLIYEGSIQPREPAGQRTVFASENSDGTVFCWIEGKGHEQAVFLRAISEVLGSIDDARFLLVRRTFVRGLREEYYAVPDVLGRKKEFAEFFATRWRRLVGPADLVYTRTPEGRRVLLRARVHALAASFQQQSERVNCWK